MTPRRSQARLAYEILTSLGPRYTRVYIGGTPHEGKQHGKDGA